MKIYGFEHLKVIKIQVFPGFWPERAISRLIPLLMLQTDQF